VVRFIRQVYCYNSKGSIRDCNSSIFVSILVHLQSTMPGKVLHSLIRLFNATWRRASENFNASANSKHHKASYEPIR